MKRAVFPIALFTAALVLTPVLTPVLTTAQENGETDLEEPSILPGNPLYGFKRWGEWVRLMLTLNKREKIRLRLKHAERRLAEADVMALRNEVQAAEQLLANYQAQMEVAEQDRERLRMRNLTVDDVDEWMNRTTNKHIYVLQRVLEKAPEEAKPGLQNALQNAERTREQIRERLIERIERRQGTTTTTTTIETTTTTTIAEAQEHEANVSQGVGIGGEGG